MPKPRKSPNRAPRRLVGYIRVSTEKQKEEGLSGAVQVENIRDYAKLHKIELVSIEEDEGRSAGTLRRPGLQRAFGMMENGEADGILAVKLDRITRSVKDLGYLMERYFAPEAGYELVAVFDTIDTSTANGRMLCTMITMITQWERESAAERTKVVYESKAARQEFCGGYAPFGFSVVERDGVRVLVKDDQERKTLRKMRELMRRGCSRSEIAEFLNRKPEKYPSRSQNGWNKQSVGRALRGARK